MKHRLLATEIYHYAKEGACDLDRFIWLIQEYSEGDISVLELLEVAALVDSWIKEQETKELPSITEVLKDHEQRLQELEKTDEYVKILIDGVNLNGLKANRDWRLLRNQLEQDERAKEAREK